MLREVYKIETNLTIQNLAELWDEFAKASFSNARFSSGKGALRIS
ncbi:hypothetical protein [Oculatella sp. LEGE 06141]|nr:hypothetical protein [Oculatella sp. LEGE 06141]